MNKLRFCDLRESGPSADENKCRRFRVLVRFPGGSFPSFMKVLFIARIHTLRAAWKLLHICIYTLGTYYAVLLENSSVYIGRVIQEPSCIRPPRDQYTTLTVVASSLLVMIKCWESQPGYCVIDTCHMQIFIENAVRSSVPCRRLST